jgi:hypothetical protein
MAVRCLGSLARHARDPVALVIHDDGSLDADDRHQLLALGAVRIVGRAEADDRVSPVLRRLPHCERFRQRNVFGLKLLDVALLGTGDIAYCDSDILFLRPFRGLFTWPGPHVSVLLTRDATNQYACAPWHLILPPRFRLPVRCNAGLFFCRRAAYDLDFIEWFLRLDLPRYQAVPTLVEQTAWAALGWRYGCHNWDPRQVALIRRREQLTNDLVAGHFADTFGRQLLADIELPEPDAAAPVVTVGTGAVRRLTGWSLAAERARVRFDGYLHRFRVARGARAAASAPAAQTPSAERRP